MGCDIHGVIEVKIDYIEGHSDYDRWCMFVNIGDIAVRYYGIFSYLFGVRGTSGAFENRGMPEDVSWSTKRTFCDKCYNVASIKEECENCADWHSLSYVTWMDLQKHLMFIDECGKNMAGWELIFDCMDWLAKRYGVENVRMIVWFDN